MKYDDYKDLTTEQLQDLIVKTNFEISDLKKLIETKELMVNKLIGLRNVKNSFDRNESVPF